MTAKQEAPALQAPVKVSKSRFNDRRVQRYFSDKDTAPLEDVFRDGKLVKGLTEYQKIAEGIRPPLAWQADEKDGKLIGRFQKTAKERAEWKEVHTNAKGPTGGGRKTRGRGETRLTLIIHRVNIHKKKSFITTISLKAYPSEVGLFLGKYHDPERRKLVSTYHYNGKTKTMD